MDVLFAAMELYGRAFDRALYVRGATRDPTHEKLTSSFNIVGSALIITTGGYIGDAPPYLRARILGELSA